MATSKCTIADLTCCAICLESFTRPKVLPCQHTYCYSCLLSLGNNDIEPITKITCPECREVHDIPKGGIAAFRDNIIVNNLLEMHASKEAVVCADCKLKPFVSPCEHCDGHLCATCLVDHAKLSLELKMCVSEIREGISRQKTDERRKKLNNALGECCTQLEKLKIFQRQRLRDMAELMINASSLERFMGMIIRVHRDLLQSSEEGTGSYLSSLSERMDICTTTACMRDLRNKFSDLKNIVRFLDNSDDQFSFVPAPEGSGPKFGRIEFGQAAVTVQGKYSTVISVDEVAERLAEWLSAPVQQHKSEKIPSSVTATTQLIDEQLELGGVACSAQCRENESDRSVSISLGIRSSVINQERPSTSVSGTVSTQPCPSDSTPRVPPFRQNQLPDHVNYLNKGEGWIPIIGQGRNVEKSKRLRCPFGVAYHVDADDIYVADSGHRRIMVYSTEGSNPRVFYNTTDVPQDVAISTDGMYVYIAAATDGLIKVDCFNSKHVKTIRKGSLGVYTDCVAVTCYKEFTVFIDEEFGCVFVYDDHDREIRHFGGKYLERPQMMGISDDGTMYITHNCQCDIEVFKWNGQRLHTFLSSKESATAYGEVAVDADGFICVINETEDRIEVYNPRGTLVACIGGPGKRPGRMNRPFSLCFMPDGRLIVADFSNNRLQIL